MRRVKVLQINKKSNKYDIVTGMLECLANDDENFDGWLQPTIMRVLEDTDEHIKVEFINKKDNLYFESDYK